MTIIDGGTGQRFNLSGEKLADDHYYRAALGEGRDFWRRW